MLAGVVGAQTLTASAPPDAMRGSPLRLRGADLSFTLQMERAGIQTRQQGVSVPVERLLAREGANLVRLRVWLDPPPGYSDLQSLLTLARRAKEARMRIFVSLHYSDFWADHQTQEPPAAWQGQDLAAMATSVFAHSREVVVQLARQDTPADLVQIGNEVTWGMLWPTGQVYRDGGEDWGPFTTLLRAGVAGVRAGAPGAHVPEIVLHTHHGGDPEGATRFVDGVVDGGVSFDTIGVSYYPFWHGALDDLRRTLTTMIDRYVKDVLVVETSYPWTTTDGDDLQNFFAARSQLPESGRFPPTPAGQAAYYEALRVVLAELPDGRGAGFVVWEPSWLPGVGWAPGEGNQYDNLTMFDGDGEALPSLRGFRPPYG